MTRHLKRLAMPTIWKIKKKGIKFVTRPSPGPHPFNLSMPLNLVLRDILGYAKNSKEVRGILLNNNIFIDGIRRKNHKFPVGLMDTIGIREIEKYYRVVLNKKGKIELIGIEKGEANLKPCRIIGKSKIKSKTQLNLYDGRNILIDKDNYKVGDSLLIKVPKQDIKKHLKFTKGAMIYLIGGKHRGEFGRVVDIIEKNVKYKNREGEIIETLKKYAFVVGEDKAVVKLKK